MDDIPFDFIHKGLRFRGKLWPLTHVGLIDTKIPGSFQVYHDKELNDKRYYWGQLTYHSNSSQFEILAVYNNTPTPNDLEIVDIINQIIQLYYE